MSYENDFKDFTEALSYIPADDYDIWLKVGMALKSEGCSLIDWILWSKKSDKYCKGDCEDKWASFGNYSGRQVTGATIIDLAKSYGFTGTRRICNLNESFDWDDEISESEDFTSEKLLPVIPDKNYKIIDTSFINGEKIIYPDINYNPAKDLQDYLNILFEPEDIICYCDRFKKIEKDGKFIKFVPEHIIKSRTAKEISEKLNKSIEYACINPKDENGAWIKFNTMDGKGESNANVVKWNFCLLESDSDSIERQYALLKALNLPIAVIVHSGGKSLHAIVRVDAKSQKQYQERTSFIYEFCKKNGYHVDEQDKNESRYSRMPGIKRGDKWQFIVAKNLGAKNYNEWRDWIENENDPLPKSVNFADVLANMPPLKPELIKGVLRTGHKLLISGPPKVGKSLLMQSLCFAIASGTKWLNYFQCLKGKVLYVNLEIDEASFYHRMANIAKSLGFDLIKNQQLFFNIEILTLRGIHQPLNKLAPKLIRKYAKDNFSAVIIDPSYKVITGDENNATDMGIFCGYFDLLAREMGASIIYSHHHSKGADNKGYRAFEKSSGSGVFSRDPDAILDLSELKVEEAFRDNYLRINPFSPLNTHTPEIEANRRLTAWQMAFTLREFESIEPLNLWMDYPIHILDQWNFLGLAKTGATDKSSRGLGKSQNSQEDWEDKLNEAYINCGGENGEEVEFSAIVGYLQDKRTGKPAESTIMKNLRAFHYSQKTKNGILYYCKHCNEL